MRSVFQHACYISILSLAAITLGACETGKTNKATIEPPSFDMESGTMIAEDTLTQADYIVAGFMPPDIGNPVLNARKKKNCAFSSYHREETVGYEFDSQNRLSFRIAPDIDLFDLGDSEAEISVRYTVFLGGPPQKKLCTFGNGYYGLVPFVSNNPEIFDNLTDIEHIKSMVEDELF